MTTMASRQVFTVPDHTADPDDTRRKRMMSLEAMRTMKKLKTTMRRRKRSVSYVIHVQINECFPTARKLDRVATCRRCGFDHIGIDTYLTRAGSS